MKLSPDPQFEGQWPSYFKLRVYDERANGRMVFESKFITRKSAIEYMNDHYQDERFSENISPLYEVTT